MQRNASSKLNSRKNRLMGCSGVLLFITILVVILAYLFHGDKRIESMLSGVDTDSLSISYTQALLHLQPNNKRLRINLAQQLANVGRVQEAYNVLAAGLLDDSADTVPLKLLSLQLLRQHFYALITTQYQRGVIKEKIATLLTSTLKQNIPVPSMEILATLALEFNNPLLATEIYAKLAAKENNKAQQWWSLAGKWSLAVGRSTEAAQYYRNAVVANPEQGAPYANMALNAFASDDPNAFALALSYVDLYSSNRRFLDRAIDIANIQNHPTLVEKWARQRLLLDPTDLPLLKRLLTIALQIGTLDFAFDTAAEMVRQFPEQLSFRLQLVDIAQWQGKNKNALEHRLWLANKNPNQAEAALVLARALENQQTIIDLYRWIAQSRSLQEKEVRELSAAFENSNQITTGKTFFREYLDRHPQQLVALKLLARLQQLSGDLASAERTWYGIGLKAEQHLEANIKRAQLYWELKQRDAALETLMALQDQVNFKHSEYWRMLGDMAWELDENTVSIRAYKILLEQNKIDALVMERLLLLEIRNGNTKQAIRYAKSGYTRYKEPRFILRGMDAAAANGHWQKFEDLLKFARSKSLLFFDNEIYWLQEAVFANYQLRYADARSHYKKALALNPKSLAARVGLLWVLLESGVQRELSLLLLRWQHDAANESAYWRVYALAYQKIGFLSKALLWYQREVKAHPDDVGLLLSYSTAFDKMGQLDAALKFRQLALRNIRQLQDQGIN